MNETMSTDVEVTTELTENEGYSQNITTEDSSEGPSKTFVGLVVGGIAAVAIGATVAWKRHKKKKLEKDLEEEEEIECFEDDLCDEEEVVDESAKETSEETKKKG